MAARKRVKKQSLNEFRAWLNGVEELQPDDWAPNASQWKLIRDKINNISEPRKDATDTEMLQKLIEQLGNNNSAPQRPANAFTGAPQGSLPAGIPPAPLPPGGVPAGPVVSTPATNLPPAPPVDLAEVAKPKDTADDGNYNSSFI